MPLFLDIHRNLEGATPASIREGHIADLEAQEAHGVKYLKYWFDEERGTVCCLVEAPSKEACDAVHRKAHGLVADEIINVESEMIAAFLGGGREDDLGAAIGSAGEHVSAFRSVMFTDIVESTALGEKLGDAEMRRLLKTHDELTRGEIDRHHGRPVKHTGDGVLASFSDVSATVTCAQAMQRAFAAHRQAHPDDPPQCNEHEESGMKQAPLLDSVEQLNRDMAEKGLEGHWSLGLEDLPAYPVTRVPPYL